MLSSLKRSVGKPDSQTDVDRTFTTLQSRAAALAESVRNLSHQLHPSALEHAGLVPALRRHCDELQQHHPVTVTFSADDPLELIGRGQQLRSMDERARLIRGRVTVDSRPGHGTALLVRIPR